MPSRENKKPVAILFREPRRAGRYRVPLNSLSSFQFGQLGRTRTYSKDIPFRLITFRLITFCHVQFLSRLGIGVKSGYVCLVAITSCPKVLKQSRAGVAPAYRTAQGVIYGPQNRGKCAGPLCSISFSHRVFKASSRRLTFANSRLRFSIS